MLAEPEHSSVPKKEINLVPWRRLNQGENPALLNEAGPAVP